MRKQTLETHRISLQQRIIMRSKTLSLYAASEDFEADDSITMYVRMYV